MMEAKKIANLIVEAVATFSTVARSAGCGCNITPGFDLTADKKTYAVLAEKYGLDSKEMKTVAGQCSGGPIEDLMRQVGFCNVWVYEEAIVLHVESLKDPQCAPVNEALRELTEREIITSSEAEHRYHAKHDKK